jgi:hypothetical protein
MTHSDLAHLALQLVWLAWLPAMAVLLARALRPAWSRDGRRVAMLLAGAAVLVAVVFALPFQVDASSIMELTATRAHEGQWKGIAGRALVAPWLRAGLGPFGVIVVARLSLILAVALAAALLVRGAGEAGGDAVPLLLGVLALLGLPSFTFGILEAHRSFFYSPLVLTTLLALRELERGPTVAGGVALVAGLVLLSFTRPELIVAALLLGGAFAYRAAARRRRLLAAGIGLAAVLCLLAVPEVLGYLFDRMRSQPLLMGSDAAGAAPTGQLAAVGLKRIVSHVPLNAACLLVSLHVVIVLAVWRLARLVRARRASWPELAAALLLLTEFVAIGIHREGFTRVAKYGQLLTVPAWYLALLGLWPELAAERRRVWQRRLVVASALFLVLNVEVSLVTPGREGPRSSRSWRARQADIALLWRDVPALGRRICSAAAPASVLVVGLDERREQFWPLGRYLGIETSQWESERSAIVHVLARSGCAVHAAYPVGALPAAALDAPVTFDEGPPRPPTHALVTWGEPYRRAELRALATGAWRVEAEVEGATLLVRGAAPRSTE